MNSPAIKLQNLSTLMTPLTKHGMPLPWA